MLYAFEVPHSIIEMAKVQLTDFCFTRPTDITKSRPAWYCTTCKCLRQ